MKNRNRKKLTAPLIAIVCAALTTPLMAQVTPAPARDLDRTDRDLNRTEVGRTATEHMKPTKLDKVSGLIGVEVRDMQGEKLGDIDDIVIDFEEGKVSYLVMASGGILGVGEKKLAVPIKAFSVSTDKDGDDAHLVLRADKDSISRAEGIGDNWPSTRNPSFGALPFWTDDDDKDVTPTRDPLRDLDEPVREQRDRIE